MASLYRYAMVLCGNVNIDSHYRTVLYKAFGCVLTAGQRAAIIYSMVEECKRTGTDFYLWLTEVLRMLPTYRVSDGYLNLLPGMLKLESPAQSRRNVTL